MQGAFASEGNSNKSRILTVLSLICAGNRESEPRFFLVLVEVIRYVHDNTLRVSRRNLVSAIAALYVTTLGVWCRHMPTSTSRDIRTLISAANTVNSQCPITSTSMSTILTHRLRKPLKRVRIQRPRGKTSNDWWVRHNQGPLAYWRHVGDVTSLSRHAFPFYCKQRLQESTHLTYSIQCYFKGKRPSI